MKQVSNINRVRCSDGTKISKSTQNYRMRLAKFDKVWKMKNEHSYVFCEECLRSSGVRLDCSHNVSVKECNETGRAELAYDVNNIKIRCRECHEKHDKLNLKSGKL